MSVNIKERLSRGTGQAKIYYSLEWGRGPGERCATGIFTFEKPRDQIQRNHNKEALEILESKQSQMVLDQQNIAAGYIPKHRYKANFLDYYAEFVANNRQANNRHVEGSYYHFKDFLKKDFLAPIEITKNLCERYRKHLLDKFNGGTPANYFSRFKRCLNAATDEGYFKISPVKDVAAKENKNYQRKGHLEIEDYLALLRTPCLDNEVREAFILSCYSGMRWCDVKPFKWIFMRGDELVFWINQAKTKVEHRIALHPIAKEILLQRFRRMDKVDWNSLVFRLPSPERAYQILDKWCRDAGITVHITWHSARLSFSILLQDASVDDATVALLLGQTSSYYVHNTYKRYRPKDASESISRLPNPIAKTKMIEYKD